jgi:hypothetical protein
MPAQDWPRFFVDGADQYHDGVVAVLDGYDRNACQRYRQCGDGMERGGEHSADGSLRAGTIVFWVWDLSGLFVHRAAYADACDDMPIHGSDTMMDVVDVARALDILLAMKDPDQTAKLLSDWKDRLTVVEGKEKAVAGMTAQAAVMQSDMLRAKAQQDQMALDRAKWEKETQDWVASTSGKEKEMAARETDIDRRERHCMDREAALAGAAASYARHEQEVSIRESQLEENERAYQERMEKLQALVTKK